LICFKPNLIHLDFLNKFASYDIFIIIDDNSTDYKKAYSQTYTKIHIIQIPNTTCKNSGFIDMNFCINKKISGREKAVYYFSHINQNYSKVWFLEDDVFFYNEQTLLNIDSKYPESDLLTNFYKENLTGHKNDWNWPNVHIKIPPPYYYAMVCAVRISKTLLSKIKDYATTYNTLFFLEALFPTLCKYNNLIYDTPEELTTVTYREKYSTELINKVNIYHPVKGIKQHVVYRQILKDKDVKSYSS